MTHPIKLDKTITDFDKKVLTMLSEGKTILEISDEVHYGFQTVANRLTLLYQKLEIDCDPHCRRVVAVAIAIRRGLIV